MSAFETYIRDLQEIRATGAAVKETSYYGALEKLLNELGKTLKPKVRCVMQLKNIGGAGMPDGGLFTASQFQKKTGDTPANPTNPERGVIEIKGTGDNAWVTAQTQQVSKYWNKYRQVLVTNYRDFVLIGQDASGQPATLETYRLAKNEAEFWQKAKNPKQFAEEQEEQVTEYLKRVMLQSASIASPQDLAWFLASYAKDAKARVEKTDLPALETLKKALEEALGIAFTGDKKDPKKGERFFKSTLIQTLFYGIFSAWVLWHKQQEQGRFDWRVAGYYLHVPMIKALFEKVATATHVRKLDLEEVLNWTGEALNRVDRTAFFSKFDEGQAVQYFYEPFLEAFDPTLRKELGVWYTPPEIVQYMVARVDTVLREELQIEDGLADPNVYILDPCCGTGAFLVEVLKRIEANLQDKGMGALVGSQLKEAAMKRVFGFEILTAPFVVAHLQLGLLLQNLGVPLSDEEERVGVYLTNALTGWKPLDPEKEKFVQLQLAALPELQEERDAAEKIKRSKKVLVVLGNPPYNSFAGMAVDEERDLSNVYRTTKKAPKPQGQGLNDLYTRFFRMAERQIVEEAGKGVVCFVSNYSYLDGLSFTGMRERYLEVFDDIWIDCLNGDKFATGKVTPTGKSDPSIFSTEWNKEGIQVGTAIALLLRKENHQPTDSVKYRDLWGVTKWQQLVESQDQDNESLYEVVKPAIALGLPLKPRKFDIGYPDYPLLTELFSTFFPGVQTKRDELVVDINKTALINRIEKYFDSSISDIEMAKICSRAVESTAQFDAPKARKYLLSRGFLPQYIVHHCYRPFDLRWLYWEPEAGLLGRRVPEYFPQVFDGNVWIVAQHKPRREWSKPQVIRSIGCIDLMDRGASCIPLFLKPEEGKLDLFSNNDRKLENGLNLNLSDKAVEYLKVIGTIADAEHLFYHVLAILHAPNYASENDGALRQDWARIPLPDNRETLIASATLGRQIATLLDPETPVSGVTSGKLRPEIKTIAVVSRVGTGNLDPNTDFALTAGWGHAGQNNVTMPGRGKVSDRPYTPEEQTALTPNPSPKAGEGLLGAATRDIYLNDIAYWKNIPDRVWSYTIGGYQVIKKWLSYREQELLGRSLKQEEVIEVTQMARRITAILLLEPELDANYQAVKQSTYPWSAQK
ncbi:type ISP restriction/modification enzyme [Phormidesmis priestleyi]|uniref:type ISP restriction/modification enzyme n=1 Tax=Phormidesmis priestleyi TaxID=268141 RepID=UPI00083B8C3A|nr:type ISP restriction/modification enzyme [Phormidesmis priestleyi]